MNHAALYCKTQHRVTKAELLNALHACIMQFDALAKHETIKTVDNKPARAEAARLLGNARHPGFEAKQSNTPLFEQAPELLKALQLVAARLETVLRHHGSTDAQVQTHPDLCAARSVIRRATRNRVRQSPNIMNPTKQINQQTPSPIKATRSNEDFDGPLYDLDEDEAPKPFTALRGAKKTLLSAHDLSTMTEADARLLAAAYTSFDTAGRALGVDAAELAEGLDLAGLIRAALQAQEALNDNLIQEGASAAEHDAEQALSTALLPYLSRLPKPPAAPQGA